MPLSDPGKPDPGNGGLWQCRALRADGSPAWLAVVWSTDRPDGERVDLPEAEASELIGDRTLCSARYNDAGAVISLFVTPLGASKAPPMWFAELTEPDATPPAISLVAFTGHHVDAGTLLDREHLQEVAVVSSDQVGAVRWYPATGEIDQVYVAPASRRQTIGSALVVAAGTLNVARDRARVWTDGQRTAMGDRMSKASPFRHRAAELTHLAPPMTPFDQR